MSINLEFNKLDKATLNFWRNVGVPIDYIKELSTTTVNNRFKVIINKLSIVELKDLASLLDIHLVDDKKKEIVECFNELSYESKKEIIILSEFLKRKKKTVSRYYGSLVNSLDSVYNSSELCQLLQLLNKDYTNLIQIYTWYNWERRGTGVKYLFKKRVSFDKAYKIPTEYAKDFIDDMYNNSNKEIKYRVFSFGLSEEKKIVIMLYRQINDGSRPDFDQPVRNKEVAPVMFQIDIENKILEIRSKFQREKVGISKYIEKTFDTTIEEIKPNLFNEYQKEEIKDAFLKGISPHNKDTSDFIVNKITFRNSPLINSPSLTFSLENGDVLPSVSAAHANESVDIESIKDIHSLSFNTMNVNRTISSTLFDEGNVIFTLNDSGMEPEVKNKIEEKFLDKFGIPLNQLISNHKYAEGKADLTDYLMTLSSKKDFTKIENETFDELLKSEIIDVKSELNTYCKNRDCNYTDNKLTESDDCPRCGSSELKTVKTESLSVSTDTVRTYIKDLVRSLCSNTDWDLGSDTKREYFKGEYNFINIDNKKTSKTLQILIHQGSISNNVLEKINRGLTPTIIIFVSVIEKHIGKYNNNTIFPITFGNIFNSTDHKKLFKNLYGTIEHRTKSYLSSVASKSFEILKNLPIPVKIGKSYSPYDFEDDVYNILKDIFPNADKWGKEMSGKEVPEGIFSLTYKVEEGGQDSTKQYVFSYDCKLNKNTKGYDLDKSEQRKAVDYVEMLNKIRHITKYSNIRQLSAHIFISNNFNSNNYDTMIKHFYNNLPEGYDTKPIFLPLDVLIYLHSEYRKNYRQIENARNSFMEAMYKTLITDNEVVEIEDVKEIMEQALDGDIADYNDIDTNKVRRSILNHLK